MFYIISVRSVCHFTLYDWMIGISQLDAHDVMPVDSVSQLGAHDVMPVDSVSQLGAHDVMPVNSVSRRQNYASSLSDCHSTSPDSKHDTIW